MALPSTKPRPPRHSVLQTALWALFASVVCAALLCSSAMLGQGLPAGDLVDTAPKLALDIGADTLSVDGTARVATFTGHVVARRDGWVLECTSLEATYDENGELERATLTGPLSLSGEDLYAEAASATYEGQDDLLVLEGDPLIKQGQSTLRAKRVTVQLETKRVEMIGVKGHLVFAPVPTVKKDAAE